MEQQRGTVVRLNPEAGFGYVRDAAGEHTLIFVVERALTHRVMGQLRAGSAVTFRVAERGRVLSLELDSSV